ncbi:hypothetical protein M231_01305 [Tremella mesenterica]|uniref:ER membrane protein complex subunit 7 beta-sandwich domain-containing protein n=1 Tax=Tremella mesenterica TaxID=5217 RepID=A0A4Q1BTS8_TREME|nr:hypothetical protein M231_01305 [Tremella mesenterica]
MYLTVQSPSVHVQTYQPARLPTPTSIPSLPYPIEIRAMGKENYFIPVGGVNVFGMLKSPMILMMLFSAGMMFVMPKLMSSMDLDPEMAKEMAQTRKKMQSMQNMDLVGSLSGMLSGSTEPVIPAPPDQPTESARSSTPKINSMTGGGRRRRK